VRVRQTRKGTNVLEILSFIFGGLFRLAPKLIEMTERKRDREHERLMIKANLEADEARAKLEVQKMEVGAALQNQLAELQALVAANASQAGKGLQKSGNGFVDFVLGMVEAANNAVRPILTYWYCVAAYGTYKACSLYLLLTQNVPVANAVTQLWTPNDHAVMFSIIGFWFVDRAIRKREQGS